jgi:hypothetical protein
MMVLQEKILNVNLSAVKINVSAILINVLSMPIYEFECPTHGRFEVIFSSVLNVNTYTCQLDSSCIADSEWVPSLTSMHPDKYWSGTSTDLGYVTSQSQYKTLQKEKNFEDISPKDLDGYKKQVARNKAEIEKKKDEERHKLAVEMCSKDDVAKDGRPINLKN